MQSLPHIYHAGASGAVAGSVAVATAGAPAISTTPPPQFGGDQDAWSPETLLCAALADCFVLTFRAVARAAHFDWHELECRVEGVLDRVEGILRFQAFTTRARLAVTPGSDTGRAMALLERAESACLIANSVSASRTLQTEIVAAAATPDPRCATC